MVCRQPAVDDGLTFDEGTLLAAPIRSKQEYGGVRVKLTASLAKIRIPVQIDVGFGDAITPAAVDLDFPALLDAPSPRLKAYPKETVVAEKFQAIVALGQVNSRIKDYYDLFALARVFHFDGELLCAALRATFERRLTPVPEDPPLGLSDGFATDPRKMTLWAAFVRREQLLHGAADFAAVIKDITQFVMPPAKAANAAKVFARNWQPGGPWKLKRGR